MAYTSTSIKEVLASVVRNLDNKLPSYYTDYILEWIPEAVSELRTPFTLNIESTPNKNCQGEYITKNHVVRLPCGLVEVLAVENEFGYRLLRSGSQLDTTNPSDFRLRSADDAARVTSFITRTSDIGTGSEDGPSVPWDGSNIVKDDRPNTRAYYDLALDYLQTSEESMFVKIHYTSLPVDSEGYPLIPDVREYKEALYWYVLMKLIGTGFQHPVIPMNLNGLDYCERKYKEYAGRALGEIKMPDQDRMGKLRNAVTRIIPPFQFYEDFFQGGEQVQSIAGI